MNRPNSAITGIDQKISTEVSRLMRESQQAWLNDTRRGEAASTVRNLALLLGAILFAIGVQLPGSGWVTAGAAAAAIVAAGFTTSWILRRRGEAALRHLSRLIRQHHNAELVRVRGDQITVRALSGVQA